MTRPQVSIRLATDGKAQVQRDFAEIADAGGAHAARLRARWESETAQIERLTDRAAKTAERLAAVSTTRSTPTSSAIDQATGLARGSATANGASFAALAQQMDNAEREAKQLLAAIDPLFAAQQRYNNQTRIAVELLKMGALDKQRYNQLIIAEKTLLDQSTAAAARNSQMRGTMRMGMQQLSFQAGDVATQLAMGTNASIIFAQQSGQVIQAMQLMGGQGNALLRFLGGPWGMVLATAAVVLTPFIGKLFETEDALDKALGKMREQAAQARLNEQANKIWESSLPGLIEKHEKLNDTLRQQIETDRERLRGQLASAKADSAIAGGERSRLERELAVAQRELDAATAGLLQFNPGGRYESATGLNRQRYDEAKAAVEQLAREFNDATIAGGKTNETVEQLTVLLARADAAALGDPVRTHFQKLRREAEETIKDVDTLTKRLADLDKQEKAALDKQKESNRGLNKVSKAETINLIRDVFGEGTQITSLTRSAEHNRRIGGDANSYHLKNGRGFAVDFVPQGGMGNFNKAEIMAAAEAAGLKVLELLGPGDKGHADHGHLAVAYSRMGPDQVARAREARERRARADGIKDLRGDNRFGDMLDALETQLLEAKSALYATSQQELELALRRIDAANDNTQRDIQMALAKGELEEAEAKALTLKNEALAEQEKANAAARKAVRDIEEQAEADKRIAQLKIDDLEFQDEMARTSAEHRRIQLQIIDALYDQRRSELEAAKAAAEKAGNIKRAAEIQAEINNLPVEKGRDEERARRGSMSPGEAYLDSLPRLQDAMERIEEIEVRGLKELNEGLLDAIKNADSFKELWGNLGEVAHNVAKRILEDLLDLAIQMFIMRPLAEALFGAGAGGGQGAGSGGGGGGGSWISSAISGLGSILGAVFGGGGGGGGGAPMFGPSNPGVGFAVGTEYFSGGHAWVGEHGPEMVRLPRGSKISTAAESRRLAAANDGGFGSLSMPITIDARGADAAGLARVEAQLAELLSTLPGTIVSTMQDARQRFMWR